MARPAVALTVIPAIALAAALVGAAPPDTITAPELRDRIAVLADDAMEGRKPGTPGGAKAETYVRQAFEDVGLIPGATGGGYVQPVRLIERIPADGSATVRAGGTTARFGQDDLILLSAQARYAATDLPLIYAGDGTGAAAARLPVTGAVVLLDGRDAADGTPLIQRIARLSARGPAALLILPASWEAARATRLRGQTALTSEDTPTVRGYLSPQTAERMLTLAGRRLGGAPGAIGRIDLTASSRIRTFDSGNIIGKVAGSDPSAGAVLLTAHWDHVGLCRPEGAPDRICNGANDNASGTAMLIEIARRIAAGPRPVRDVYFVATTAEEMGLLGAQALAEAPPVPLSHIVAALNLDTAVIAPVGMPVAILGRGNTPALDAAIDKVSAAAGRKVDTDDEAGVMFTRQDGFEFARRGVPAVMVSGSFSDFALLKAYLGKDYHQPTDDLAHLPDLAGAAEDATLHVGLIRALADPAVYAGPGRDARRMPYFPPPTAREKK